MPQFPEITGYTIERELGRGGMATVYLAQQLSLERSVALKIMKPALSADEEFAERFVREARTAAGLRHPGIVAIFDAGVAEHSPYMAMEIVEGGDLKHKLRQGALDPDEAVRIVRQLAAALSYAHEKGFVHRDVKPENILFREDGSAVLTDFGIARAIGSGTRMTATGLSIGTPHYMSPEQARGEEVDGRSDLYALGVVLFEMLTGNVPFDAQDSFAVAYQHINGAVPDLPPSLSAYQPIVDRLLAKGTSERYQTGEALVADLDRLDKGEAIKPAGRATRVMKKADHATTADHGITESRNDGSSGSGGSRSGLYWALGGGALAVVLAAGMYFWQEKSRPMPASGGSSVTAARQAPSASERAAPETRNQSAEPVLPGTDERNDSTLRAQQLLNRLGYTVLESGKLDARTEASIRDFEQAQNLVPSGAVDEILLQRLQGEYNQRHQQAWNEATRGGTLGAYRIYLEAFPDGANVERARIEMSRIEQAERDRRQLVRDIQTELRRLGRGITPDGEYGPATASEVRAFERAVSRDISGTASEELLAALKSTDDWPRPRSGDVFQDCPDCPEMVVIPAGNFLMGSPSSEPQRGTNEGPQHRVTLEPFALGQTEVTFEQWQACVSDGGCSHRPSGNTWGHGNRPVISVSWNDAQEYLTWLSHKTGEDYRLPSESEWEYAARAGTTTRFHTGNCITTDQANFDGDRPAQGCRQGEDRGRTVPVGSFAPNAFGLYDMHGNVVEWVQDCWNRSYNRAPDDGRAWMRGDCGRAVLRGGSWYGGGLFVRSANRLHRKRGTRSINIGFRVARSVTL